MVRRTPGTAASAAATAGASEGGHSTLTCGPASMVGFDLARTFIPKEASGRANGFVNVGGFSASLLTMAFIGVLLDWHSGGGSASYDLDDFRVAMSVQFVHEYLKEM